jgi:hypothetical protein
MNLTKLSKIQPAHLGALILVLMPVLHLLMWLAMAVIAVIAARDVLRCIGRHARALWSGRADTAALGEPE